MNAGKSDKNSIAEAQRMLAEISADPANPMILWRDARNVGTLMMLCDRKPSDKWLTVAKTNLISFEIL